jgi:hypothetical protein
MRRRVPTHLTHVPCHPHIHIYIHIAGVVYVVDCCFVKQRAYNPLTGLDSLLVAPLSKVTCYVNSLARILRYLRMDISVALTSCAWASYVRGVTGASLSVLPAGLGGAASGPGGAGARGPLLPAVHGGGLRAAAGGEGSQ